MQNTLQLLIGMADAAMSDKSCHTVPGFRGFILWLIASFIYIVMFTMAVAIVCAFVFVAAGTGVILLGQTCTTLGWFWKALASCL